MKVIYAYKLLENEDGIEIIIDQTDRQLAAIYGKDRLYTSLILPTKTVEALRTFFEISDKVTTRFFLERTLRSYKGIERILDSTKKLKLRYKLSAHTHC